MIRSFDVNKPGAEVDELKGGVAGGSILKGVLRVSAYLVASDSRSHVARCGLFAQVGQEIEVRPGIVSKTSEGIQCQPILSRIISLFTEKNELQYAVPGGLIGEREEERGGGELMTRLLPLLAS